MTTIPAAGSAEHTVSVVIPVYNGESTLPELLADVSAWTTSGTTPDGHFFRVIEAILVFDNGRPGSAQVMRELAAAYDFVRTVWLSRNFGQHAATIAGMASSGGDWILTIDEDRQHDPAFLPGFLDAAMREQTSLVYAQPINRAPHSWFRNLTSRGAKWVLTRVLAGPRAFDYHSFRFVLGEVGRSVAAYAGSNVYLDVALGWVAADPALVPVELREEGGRRSGYSTRRLLSHFWRMVLTSGTRGLRIVSAIGVGFATLGIAMTVWVLLSRLAGTDVPEGWASTLIVILVSVGAILFSLGVIAEYLGVAVNMALGKPPYLIVTDPRSGPLGRTPRR